MTYEIISKRKMRNPGRIATPQDACNLFKRYAKGKQEQFLVLTLNATHEPVSLSIAFIGMVNRILVHPREVFFRAVRDMATAVIVCHNHPSGSLDPSPEDLDITASLCEAGTVLGIHVLDHLVITRSGFVSLKKEGYLPPVGEAGERFARVRSDDREDQTRRTGNTKPCPFPD
jgi:DNA repair protein RadC